MNVHLNDILTVVARGHNMTVERMLYRQRTSELVRPRQIAMKIARDITKLSLPAIGARFGMDHTTVIHSVRLVEKKMKEDPEFQAEVLALQRACLNRVIERQKVQVAASAPIAASAT